MGETGPDRARLAGDRASVARLAALAAPADEYQWMVLRAIGRQRRPETSELLAAHLDADDPRVRAAAIYAVTEANPRVAAALIGPLADDPEPRVAEAVAGALVIAATPADLPVLAGLARHGSADVREHAAEALGALDDPRALPLVAELLADRSRFVRREARGALRDSALPAAADTLDSNSRRGALGRLRDVRAARRRARLLALPPRWLVVATDHTLVTASSAAVYAIALLALALAIADASCVIVPLALLLAAVVYVASALATSNDPTPELIEHDRARARARIAPTDVPILGRFRVITLLALDPRRHARPVALVGVVLGLELLLPTGGALATVVASLFLVVAQRLLRARRRIMAAGVLILTSLDQRGRVRRDFWLAPPVPPTPDVRPIAV